MSSPGSLRDHASRAWAEANPGESWGDLTSEEQQQILEDAGVPGPGEEPDRSGPARSAPVERDFWGNLREGYGKDGRDALTAQQQAEAKLLDVAYEDADTEAAKGRSRFLLGDPRQPEADPWDVAASRRALTDLQGRAFGYRSQEERAREDAMRGEAESRLQGFQGAAGQAFAETGGGQAAASANAIGGAQMQNQFGATWQNDMAAQQEAARQEALGQLGQYAGQYRRQGFGEQQKRNALSDFNRLNNITYRRGVKVRNAGREEQGSGNASDVAQGNAAIAQGRANAAWDSTRRQIGNITNAAAGATNTDSKYEEDNVYG